MKSAPVLAQVSRTLATICVFGACSTVFALETIGTSKAPPPSSASHTLKLHVASPDWRDQIIYFLVTDRFDDGDSTNNDQAKGEFDAASNEKYNGGDLAGIARRIGYIRQLGATAIWLTPPVANQWWDPLTRYSGYHGYWPEHFMRVDPHLGTLDDYKKLSHALHSAGMYLIQDIVVNHTGNFFTYDGGWNPKDPTAGFAINGDSRPVKAPSQWPFSLNDPRIPEHLRAGVYHWTPNVNDFTNAHQELNFQMAGLDDLNTEARLVRDALRQSYGYWIKEVGVDAFRIDTAFYVPPTYFADFLYSRDKQYPGIMNVARQTGRQHFHVFGEGFGIDKPFADKEARKIERYMTGPDGRALLPGMLNFPLYGTMGDVFARGRPTAALSHRINSMMKLHKRPHLMPTFVDNHDVDRFLVGGTEAGLKQSLLMIMTLPGIPIIYYGTEQAFTEQRAAMFKAGFKSGGRDRFDTTAPLFRFISAAAAMRRSNQVFSRGKPLVLKDNSAGAGGLVYQISNGTDSALVAFNSAATETLLDNINSNLPAGTVLEGLFGIEGTPANVIVGENGKVTLRLAPHAGVVWKVTSRKEPLIRSSSRLTINNLPSSSIRGDFHVSGTSQEVGSLQLVVDGNISTAQYITPSSDGRWAANVDTSNMLDPTVNHTVTAWTTPPMSHHQAVSETRSFRVARDWKLLADVADPLGDDSGPLGTYRYPSDTTYGDNRQMDIHRVRVSGTGGALKIEISTNKVTTSWNPPNGFDHVAFTVFIGIPGRDGGSVVMPLQNSILPSEMRWNYRLRAHGWTNVLFSAEGASASHEGKLVTPAADIHVSHNQNTVTFILRAGVLGHLKSLSGVKIYVTTWDYDGGYRALTPSIGSASISGGITARDPLVMDDVSVITLP